MTVESSAETTSRLPIMPALRVLMVSPGYIASCQIMNTIFRGLHDQGALSYLCLYDQETEYPERRDAVEWADIIFFFRSFDPQALTLLRLAKEAGKGTVYCTDDDFLKLDKESPLGKVHHAPENAQAFRAMFREADLVWLFTEEMAERYRKISSRIVLGELPSPFEMFPLSERRALEDEGVNTIGYAGGFTHQKDLNIVTRPMLRLLNDSSVSLRVEFVGYMPEGFRGHSKVKHIPYFENLGDFYSYMARTRWTVGLGLLEDTPFNRGKTNNKYREFAAFGIPGIYSDMPVYSACVTHRVNGYLTPNTEEGIDEALCAMLTDPELRRNIREHALRDVTCSYSLKAAQQQLLREISSLAIDKLHVSKPKLLVVGYDKVATTHIDALQPCRELERRNLLDFIWKEPGQATEQDVDAVDCVYLVRAFEAAALPVLEWVERKQKPMICSWDDNFFVLPKDSPLGQLWAQPKVRSIMEKFLHQCSLIMASTPPLAVLSRTFNPNVMEAIYGLTPPDCTDRDKHRPNLEDHKVRIGFFGANQSINTPFVIDALKELKKRYESRIIIETIGSIVNEELISVIDSRFGTVPHYDEALRLLRSRRWDIGLAPLADTDFNSAKQATKFRDYAWCGAAIVASDVPAYRRAIVDGVHGLLVENTPKAWVEGIVSLMEDREKQRFVATGANKLLENIHMQDKTVASWYQLLWRIMKLKLKNLEACHSSSLQSIVSPTPTNEIVESPSSLSLDDLLLRHGLNYHVVPSHSGWSGIDVPSRIDHREVGGILHLRILTKSGFVLRETTAFLEDTRDRDWLEFRFPPIVNSASIPFTLKFTLTNAEQNKTAHSDADHPGGGFWRRLLRRPTRWAVGDGLRCRLRFGNKP